MKEIEEDTNNWKDILYSWIGRINIVKISILHKLFYRFNAISIKIPMTFFIEIEKSLDSYGPTKDPEGLNQSLEKNKAIDNTLPDFKFY